MVDISPPEVTPEAGEGALGAWRFRTGPRLRTGSAGFLIEERASTANHGYTGRIGVSRQRFVPWWAGGEGTAKVRTGLGKTRCPGSQGGLGKRGPWSAWEPSPQPKGRCWSLRPKGTRASALSRLPCAKKLGKGESDVRSITETFRRNSAGNQSLLVELASSQKRVLRLVG
jgi:hypothetical protein